MRQQHVEHFLCINRIRTEVSSEYRSLLLARSVPEAAQLRSRMWMSLRPMRVDWRPIFTSTASMLGECIPQYGDMSSAAHVCSRLAVCAAALAIIASRSET